MGLYPVLAGEPIFQICSSVFDRILIKLAGEKTFEIISKNRSDNSIYIQSATLNGKEFNQTNINHEDIISGCMLIFGLSDKPNENRGQ